MFTATTKKPTQRDPLEKGIDKSQWNSKKTKKTAFFSSSPGNEEGVKLILSLLQIDHSLGGWGFS